MAWSSYTGFMLACIGASVGLGNIWRFPYVVGETGGGAFVLIYLATIFAIVVPIAAAELLVGRMGRDGAVGSIRKLAQENGRPAYFAAIGGIGVFASFLLLTFYAVIAGWVMAYVARSATGDLAGLDAESARGVFNALLGSPTTLISYQILFLALIGLILMRNIASGLERANTLLMPILVVMLLVIALYGIIAGDAGSAVAYLFSADFSKINSDAVVRAIGQGFFSVGVGAAMLITYGAYINRDIDLGRAAIMIGIADTAIALLAGFGIFAIVFAQSMAPNAGPGLIFITLPIAFANMPMGGVIGFVFFVLVSFAALTSGLALAEVVIRWAEGRFGLGRPRTVLAVLGVTFLVGLLTVFSFNIWSDVRVGAGGFWQDKTLFDLKDRLSSDVLLPLGGLLVVLFASWGLDPTRTAQAFGGGARMFAIWLWLGRVVAPLGILLMLTALL